MKKIILISSILSMSLFAFNAFGKSSGNQFGSYNGNNNNSSFQQNNHNNNPQDPLKSKIKYMKEVYKLKENIQLKQIKLQNIILKNKIKMLKEKLQTLTSTPPKIMKNTVLNYGLDPKIIVKTIDYSIIRKKPIYLGLLMYYESQSILKNATQKNSGKILFSSPLGQK